MCVWHDDDALPKTEALDTLLEEVEEPDKDILSRMLLGPSASTHTHTTHVTSPSPLEYLPHISNSKVNYYATITKS